MNENDIDLPETPDEPEDEPCLPDGTPLFPKRRLTRMERLQLAADAGFDTWDDYNGER